jgi:hypothetical protein
MMNSFTSLFVRDLSKKRPVALDVSGGLITWQKFETDIGALYLRLSRNSQSRWALCFDNSYWFAVSLFALALADKDIVMPSNTSSKKALSDINQHFDAILTDQDLSNECVVWHPEAGVCKCEIPKRLLDNVNITLFTSGSTGAATSIQKTFQQLANEVNVLENLFGSSVRFLELFRISIYTAFCFAFSYPCLSVCHFQIRCLNILTKLQTCRQVIAPWLAVPRF